MPLISCEINLILLSYSWSVNCVISAATGVTTLTITDTAFYILVVTYKDNASLLCQLKTEYSQKSN